MNEPLIFVSMEPNIPDILHRYDLKATPVRVEVLALMIRTPSAMSHGAITEALGPASSVDKVTLYRTLNAFTEKGILHRIPTEDRNWLYAVSPDLDSPSHDLSAPHAHFVCDECEKVFCLPVNDPMPVIDLPSPGYVMKSQEIVIHGHCPTCHE